MNQSRNIVLILTDQERDAGAYESEGMASFRASQLPARLRLFSEGLRFRQHRINTAACVPSRVSIFTGYSPWEHGVHQTDGFAKLHDDPDIHWLPPDRVPTLGHRFQAHGWDTAYFGKWHLSYANLHDEDGTVLGASEVGAYEHADQLAAYGFHGWTGPEPHGAELANSGLFRDEGYVAQAKTWLQRRAASSRESGFLLVVSLVNPHDIVFWPPWSLWQSKLLDVDAIDEIGESPSESQVSGHLPAVLRAYRKRYPSAYGPASIVNWLYRRNPERYRKFYCSLLRRSDKLLGQLLECLDETGLRDSTSVVFSSDHGELLGAHGGLHQKWYNAYEETLRVPLVISEPNMPSAGESTDRASNHLDLVPTLLGLAGLSQDLPRQVHERFEDVPRLRGRDLLNDTVPKHSYFVTHDHILEGKHREAAFGRRFPWVGAIWRMRYEPLDAENTAVEAVVERIVESGGQSRLWKLVRYFNPLFSQIQDTDEWSLFCLDEDPTEIEDLFGKAAYEEVVIHLKSRLAEERAFGTDIGCNLKNG